MSRVEDKDFQKARLSGWWYVLLLVPFLVYLKGLAPSVVIGDTGDYQTAGWIWGVAHQPGYPLYTILVGIFERLPIPPVWISVDELSVIAWRANLLSAIFATSAVGVLFALVRRLTGSNVGAIIAAGSLAFCRTFWWHAEIAENDALSALFILLILLISVRWAQERRASDKWLLALTIGLALSHHQSIILFLPAIFVFLYLRKAISFSAVQWMGLVLVFILGLAPLLYLPIVRYKTVNGPVVFNATETEGNENARYTDKSPVRYFFDYVGRSIYSEQRTYTQTAEALGEDRTNTFDVLRFYVILVLQDFGSPLLIAGLFGLFFGFRIRPPTGGRSEDGRAGLHNWILVVTAYGVYFLVIHLYPSGDILRAPMYHLTSAGPGLMLPLEVIFSVLIGLGMAELIDGSRNKLYFGRIRPDYALLAVGLLAIAINACFNFPYSNKSGNTLAHEYSLMVLDSCPEDGIVIAAGDEIYALTYMHTVHPDPSGGHGYRRDVHLTAWGGELENLSDLADIPGAMASAVARLATENPGQEIDTTFFNSRFFDKPVLNARTLARRGILFSFIPPGETSALEPAVDKLVAQTGVEFFQPELPMSYPYEFWERGGIPPDGLWPPEAEVQWRIGEMLIFYGTQALLSADNERAEMYFRKLLQVEPYNPEAEEYLEAVLMNR